MCSSWLKGVFVNSRADLYFHLNCNTDKNFLNKCGVCIMIVAVGLIAKTWELKKNQHDQEIGEKHLGRSAVTYRCNYNGAILRMKVLCNDVKVTTSEIDDTLQDIIYSNLLICVYVCVYALICFWIFCVIKTKYTKFYLRLLQKRTVYAYDLYYWKAKITTSSLICLTLVRCTRTK